MQIDAASVRQVVRTKLADTVIQQFLSMIRRGDWQQGHRLPPERELAELFNVSRGTLRSAIQELAFLGYVDVRQGDGTYVCLPDNQVLAQPFKALLAGQPQLSRDLMQFRYIVEPQMARLAARNCGAADAERLHARIAEQVAMADQQKRLVAEDIALHAEIARIAGNRLLLEVGDLLRNILEESRYQGSLAKNPNHETIRQHRLIVDAIVAGDEQGASDAMAAHLRWVIAGAGFDPATF
jgi:GntR family transcriptional repressor for pyruvate dehydrogenase complex